MISLSLRFAIPALLNHLKGCAKLTSYRVKNKIGEICFLCNIELYLWNSCDARNIFFERIPGDRKIWEENEMNGVVSKLYDIDSIVIPEELLKVSVDEQQITDEVKQLALRYAKEEKVDVVSSGDLVCAKADQKSYPDGRTILVYTGLQMPGAEVAVDALIGKHQGEKIETVLNGKNVTLVIEKIVRRTPVEVTDELAAGMGLEDVTDLESYKAYLRKKMAADQEMEKSKEITRYILDQMVENSTFTYDEAEMENYVQEELKKYQQEMSEYGDEMEDVPEDEIKEGIIAQEKQTWMVKAFCESKGIDVDTSSAEEEADRMIEMMQLMGEDIPDRAEMIAMSVQDAYFGALLDYIDKMVEEKKGGTYGNC